MAPPISPYTGPGWSPPFCRVPLVLWLVFYVLLCDIPPIFMAIFWSVSPTPACPLLVTPIRGCSLDTCVACTWLDLLSSSALFQDSVICADLWSRQSGPPTACDRHSVALALSLDYGGFDPLLLRYAWWSSSPGWLLNLSLAGMYVEAFLLWTLAVPWGWVDFTSPLRTSRTLSHA